MQSLILIEHWDREKEVALSLSKALDEKGVKVAIWSLVFDVWQAPSQKFDIIFTPYAICSSSFPYSILRALYPKAVFVSLNFEQILHKANKSFRQVQDPFCQRHVVHFSYNEEFRKFLKDSGVAAENILFSRPYSHLNYATSNANRIIPPRDKYSILIVSSFSWAWYSDSKILKKIATGYDRDDAFNYRAYSKTQIDSYFSLMNKLTDLFDIEIIFRPHPSESCSLYQAQYESRFGRSDKVIFEDSATAYDWIVGTDMLIGSWSTLLFDIMRVHPHKIIRFNPDPLPDYLQMGWLETVPQSSEDDIVARLSEDIKRHQKAGQNAIASPEMDISDFFTDQIDVVLELAKTSNKQTSARPRFQLGMKDYIYLIRSSFYCVMHKFLPHLLTDALKRDAFKLGGFR